jgi:hypothetical protein
MRGTGDSAEETCGQAGGGVGRPAPSAKQLQRRAKELGYELKKIEPKVQTVIVNGQELTVKADGEIVAAK